MLTKLSYDAVLILLTVVSAWFISADVMIRMNLIFLALLFSITGIIFLHYKKMQVDDYSGWIFLIILFTIITIVMMRLTPAYWKFAIILSEGRTEEAAHLWPPNGGLFVFIGLIGLYASVAGIIRHTLLLLVNRIYKYIEK